VLGEVLGKDLPGNADRMGKYLIAKLQNLVRSVGIGEIRGQGLLVAFDLPKSLGEEVANVCMELGLLVNSPQPSTLRLMPPLIVQKNHIDEATDILEKAIFEIL